MINFCIEKHYVKCWDRFGQQMLWRNCNKNLEVRTPFGSFTKILFEFLKLKKKTKNFAYNKSHIWITFRNSIVRNRLENVRKMWNSAQLMLMKSGDTDTFLIDYHICLKCWKFQENFLFEFNGVYVRLNFPQKRI